MTRLSASEVARRISLAVAAPALAAGLACSKVEDGSRRVPSEPSSMVNPSGSGGSGESDPASEGLPASQLEDLTWTAPPNAVGLDLRIASQAGGGTPSVNASGDILLASRGYADDDGLGNTMPVLTRRSSEGDALWSNAYLSDAFLFPVLLPDGSALVAGDFRGRLELGGSALESTRNPEPQTGSGFTSSDPYARGGLSRDIALFRTSREGQVEWSRRFGGAGDQMARALALTAAGELIVAGPFVGELAMDEHRIASTNGATTPDVFVARVDAGGIVRALARLDYAQVDAICADAAGSVWLAGRVARGIGGDELGDHNIVKLGPDGELQVSLHVSDDSIVYAASMTCSPDGSVYILYSSASNAALFGIERRSHGALVALSSEGSLRWLARLDSRFITGFVASEPSGNVAVAGAAAPTIDLGGGPLAAGRSEEIDLFVASFEPDGDSRYAFRIGGEGLDGAGGIAAISSSRWLVSFYSSGPVVALGEPLAAGEHLLWIDER